MQTTLNEIKLYMHGCHVHNCRLTNWIVPGFTAGLASSLISNDYFNFLIKSFLCVHGLVQNGNFHLTITRVQFSSVTEFTLYPGL